MEINLSQSIKKESFLKRYISENVYPKRFLNFGRNTKLSKCIGIIGPRGSCKSIAASAMGIMDYLIPGYKLISNMNVRYAVKLGDLLAIYESAELDKMELLKFNFEDNVAALIDEVNIEFSEARRSMTNRNLIFNKLLQQLRKRAMNLIYTVQHEMWIDNRLRWQTDIFIKTKDVCLKPGGIYLPYDFGEYASWKIYDMMGIFGQGTYPETMKPVIEDWRFHAKRWWGTFDTKQIQGLDAENYGKDEDDIKIKRTEHVIQTERNYAEVYDIMQKLNNEGITSIKTDELWKKLNVTTHKAKIYVSKILKEMGVIYAPWAKSYTIPETNLDRPETLKKVEVPA